MILFHDDIFTPNTPNGDPVLNDFGLTFGGAQLARGVSWW